MTDTQTEVTNPLISYAIREDGVMVVIAEGDGNSNTVNILFTDVDPLLSAAAGLMDAVKVRDLYDQYGFESALSYIEADEDELVPEATDDAIEAFLEGE